MTKVLIVGATSAIAGACARLWAKKGASFFLVARDTDRLEQVAADLALRGAAAAHTWKMDATDTNAHEGMIDAAWRALGGIDVALIAHGTLPDQAACQASASLTLREFVTNGGSVIALLTALGQRFESNRHGSIAVITSVAGDRGRPSNYVYGSAKAAVSVFCEGLRGRLFKAGVSVTDIRPGFVATPMTEGLPLPAALVVRPETAARRIVNGVERRRDVLYVPGFWWAIMAVIRTIPRFIFKRLNL